TVQWTRLTRLTLSANLTANRSLYDPADPLVPDLRVDATEAVQAGFRLQLSQRLTPRLFVDLLARGERVDYRDWDYDHDTRALGFGLRFNPNSVWRFSTQLEYAEVLFAQESPRGPFGLPIPGSLLEMNRWRSSLDVAFFKVWTDQKL
ncbi:hypothetical protein RZS08_21860, partial [Arthrospira platensis SPKY1]|nr:hypothetical protein [Arthrospira platensis SPKY1]